jgi:hypothetical protein
MTVVINLWPFLSKRLPMKPISRPAARVPAEYIPETIDRLHPNSSM